jgi:glucose uptake protein GlcU
MKDWLEEWWLTALVIAVIVICIAAVFGNAYMKGQARKNEPNDARFVSRQVKIPLSTFDSTYIIVDKKTNKEFLYITGHEVCTVIDLGSTQTAETSP